MSNIKNREGMTRKSKRDRNLDKNDESLFSILTHKEEDYMEDQMSKYDAYYVLFLNINIGELSLERSRNIFEVNDVKFYSFK